MERLEGLPRGGTVAARVVNCISLGQYEKLWLLGLALEEPGNVWGIQSPPGRLEGVETGEISNLGGDRERTRICLNSLLDLA